MDAFLEKESSAVQRPNPRSEQASSANLLFNPNNRRRFVFPTPADKQGSGKGPPLGGGGASGYWQLRTSKLTEQAPREVSQLFRGLSFYFNGRSGDKQTMHLKGAVSKHGGRTTPFMSMKGVTHVIAENLSAVKTDKAMKSLKMKVVHPDWVSRCIEEGKLLPDAPFRVVRSQKVGMENFLGSSSASSSLSSSKPASALYGRCGNSSSAHKENKKLDTPSRRRPSSGSSTAGPYERHAGEKGRGSRGAGGRRGGYDSGSAGAADARSSNGRGDGKKNGANVGALTSGGVSKSVGSRGSGNGSSSGKKRARTGSSRDARTPGSSSTRDPSGTEERELDPRKPRVRRGSAPMDTVSPGAGKTGRGGVGAVSPVAFAESGPRSPSGALVQREEGGARPHGRTEDDAGVDADAAAALPSKTAMKQTAPVAGSEDRWSTAGARAAAAAPKQHRENR